MVVYVAVIGLERGRDHVDRTALHHVQDFAKWRGHPSESNQVLPQGEDLSLELRALLRLQHGVLDFLGPVLEVIERGEVTIDDLVQQDIEEVSASLGGEM